MPFPVNKEVKNKKHSNKSTDILLICMPLGDLAEPSIGLHLLRSTVAQLGFSTKVLYLTFLFAKMIGVYSYLQILKKIDRVGLVGDWIFSDALFRKFQIEEDEYIDEILRGKSSKPGSFLKPISENLIKTVLKIRVRVEPFLEKGLGEALSFQPRIVGFTSTLQQHLASLSLAKRIKAHSPETFIVFGGPNCEGIMGVELIRQFPFVDAVVSGEGELVFPEIVARILEDKPLFDLQGVYTQRGPLPESMNDHYPNALSVCDMDDLPFLDYDDYYEQLETSGLNLPRDPSNLLETSRGCWWGEKSHCTFCGSNPANIHFRSKSSRRALDEITWITERYPNKPIEMVDRILNMDYFDDFIPELAYRRLDTDIFYTIKANLEKEQICALRDAGITTVEPGIESLSTLILKLMHKGVSAIKNIQLLKWCREFGLCVYWNLIYGLPFESPDEYKRMTSLIPLLTHLEPPRYVTELQVHRFSPYFEDPEKYGFSEITPLPAYKYIYPFEPQVIANLAYFFTYNYRSIQKVDEYSKPLLEQIKLWIKSHESSDLFYFDDGTKLLIWDQRPISSEFLIELEGLQRILYIDCDRIRNIPYLQKMVGKLNGGKCSKEEIEKILHRLVEGKLMIREGNFYLSLAIPLGPYFPNKGTFERFQKHLIKIDELSSQESFMAKIKIKDLPEEVKVGREEMKKSLKPDTKGGDLERKGFV